MLRQEPFDTNREPWNKGKLIGQKPPLKLKEIWSIRIRLQIANKLRDLALFNLAIDSKLRGCDLLKLRLSDVEHDGRVMSRAIIGQWRDSARLRPGDYLFPSRLTHSPHLSTRQYARVVESWVSGIGLDPSVYGTHSMRRTKATLIYRETKNLRAVQLLLGHTKLESTVRYLGIELEDALVIAEKMDV
jgi:integrase